MCERARGFLSRIDKKVLAVLNERREGGERGWKGRGERWVIDVWPGGRRDGRVLGLGVDMGREACRRLRVGGIWRLIASYHQRRAVLRRPSRRRPR